MNNFMDCLIYKFTLTYYSKTYNRYFSKVIGLVENGWAVENAFLNQWFSEDKYLHSFVYELHQQVILAFPNNLSMHFASLWDYAQVKSYEEVQNAFNALGKWISECEMNEPIFYIDGNY